MHSLLKVVLAVLKQLKQLQRKPRKKFLGFLEAGQVRVHLYPLYEESEIMCI